MNPSSTTSELSNQMIISKKSFVKGTAEVFIETYIDDEFLIHSALLCLLSVLSFWPVIYFLKRQE